MLGCGCCGPLNDVQQWTPKKLALWLTRLRAGRYEKYVPYLKEMDGKQFAAMSKGDVLEWCQAAATDAGVVAALADSASFRRLSRADSAVRVNADGTTTKIDETKVGAAADATDLHEVYQDLCHEARCYAAPPFPWSPRRLFVLTLIRGGSADPGSRENRPKILIAAFLGVRCGRELRHLRASHAQLTILVKAGNAQAKADAKAEGQSALRKLRVFN